jgi:hypothetical protein
MMRRLLSVALALSATAGCDQSLDRPIHFRVPAGFSGPFIIVSDPQHEDRISVETNRYELTVPDDGIIRTKNTDIFARWHKTTAADSNGRDISAMLFGGPTSTSTNVRYISWYYVGKYDDFHAFMYDDVHPKKRFEWLKQHGISY